MLGWIGLVLLMFAYLLLVTKHSRWFIPVDIVASLALTTHAVVIGDIPFMVVNGFIVVMLFVKYVQGGEVK